jgi:PAT family beta-lactamase induction signal transducer AmpG
MNNAPHQFIRPIYVFFLQLPSGISSGFITVVIPYLLSKNGFPVALTASIVAVGVSANVWRFFWGPIVDVFLSLRKWYWIGLISTTTSLLLICLTPFTVKGAVLLSVIVFISQVAATFILLPINGIMAHRIEGTKIGKACGWYEAGNFAGTGLGGGAGLWLATHYSVILSGIVLCTASFVFALITLLIEDIPHNKEKTILYELKEIGKDIFAMLKVPVGLFVSILLLMPIGTNAAADLWSAIAQDWKADLNTVVLVTGLLSGLISALGCIAGGVIADRWGVWVAYLGCGLICAIVTFIMALMPLQPAVYIGGVLAYAFTNGMAYAAFTSMILFAIGKKNVATKFSLLASLGNLPVVYMTAINGRVHDKFNSQYMLMFEAIAGIVSVVIFFFILKYLIREKLISSITN